MVMRPRSLVPSGDGESISSARAAAGNSPSTLARPRTRVRSAPGMRIPWPTPDVPDVDGPPAAGSGHMTPPSRSRLPVTMLTAFMSHDAAVPKDWGARPSTTTPAVVVPMRP
ncbi:unannotated protein [freshwater metagenome]|uniref:Unannotated protein n=1 Tax=freshwater metagenome TaxID=449393 RepID=A0A6J7NYV3_9ZZZZ